MRGRNILPIASLLRTRLHPIAQGVILAVTLVATSGLTTPIAIAASICSKVTHMKYGETRARFGPTLGSVRKDGSTHAVIYHLDRNAPLGWSHSLRLWKDDQQPDWRLQLVAVDPMADTRQAFVLKIDREPKLTFTKSQINSPQSVNEYELTSENGEIRRTIDDLKAGNRLTWQYVSESGNRESVVFSLSGLTAALRWLDCAGRSENRSNAHSISNDRKARNDCQGSYKSCILRMPADYQGHPGREANWRTKCEATRNQCLPKSGSTASSHWCNRNNLNLSEKTICKNGSLRRLDTKMTDVYTNTLETMAAKGRAYIRLPLLKKQQLKWIKGRNRCGARRKCLIRSYEARLAALAGNPSSAAFVGTWGINLAQCRVPQDQQGAPIVLTMRGYDQHEAHCTFKSMKKMGDLWKIAADCSVEGDKLSDAFTLRTSGKSLIMAHGKIRTTLMRCD